MLIGLSGVARSGKDTVAGFLVAERGFHRVAFADALKAVLADVDPLMGSHTRLHDRLEHGWELAKSEPEVRMLLQRLGVACRNHIGSDVWVEAVFARIEEAMDNEGPSRWVVSDVRFPNEAEAIRSRGGQVWRVERPGFGPVNDHVSESALAAGFHFDQVVENDGTLADLRAVVLELADCVAPAIA